MKGLISDHAQYKSGFSLYIYLILYFFLAFTFFLIDLLDDVLVVDELPLDCNTFNEAVLVVPVEPVTVLLSLRASLDPLEERES